MLAHVSPGAPRTGPESAVRVLAGGFPMGVGPRQDLLDVQARQVLLVADAPVLLEQIGQRGPARQAAVALTQGAVDLRPVQRRVVAHRAGIDSRPLAGGRMVGVGPGQDQVDRQAGFRPRLRARRRDGRRVRETARPPRPASARRAPPGSSPSVTPRSSASSSASDEPPGQPASAPPQGRVDRRPGLVVYAADRPGTPIGPTPGRGAVGIGPAQDPLDIQRRPLHGRRTRRASVLSPRAARDAPDPSLIIPPPRRLIRPIERPYYTFIGWRTHKVQPIIAFVATRFAANTRPGR